MESKQLVRKNPEFQPADEIASGYANHVFMEPSFWDLKLLFGQLDQSVEPLTVKQHTEITTSWAQAKVMNHFFNVQIAAYELMNGKIRLSKTILPAEIAAPTPEQLNEEPTSQRMYETLKKLRDEFVANA
jgi:hypothetical protein